MRLQIDEAQKELKSHGSYEFPVLVSDERLSWFDTGDFPWHWHPEVELTLIREGNMTYLVNDNEYVLHAGEGLFCNTNVLHAGKHYEAEDCSYLSVTFHPRLLYGYGSSLMQSKYMEGILKSPSLSSIYLRKEVPWQKLILDRIETIRLLHQEGSDSAELRIQIALMEIWLEIYEHVRCPEEPEEHSRDIERIRTLMEYMQKHYMEKITLEDLAGEIHLCKSESCRLFKRYMKESMFEYLLDYRIGRSLELLRNSGMDVTQIAGHCGFSNPGYYARIFRRKMGCTPLEYRKRRKRDCLSHR